MQIPVVQILDFRHAYDAMITAVKAGSLTQQQIKLMLKRIKKWRDIGHVDKVIEALSTLDNSRDTKEQIRLAMPLMGKHQRFSFRSVLSADSKKQG